MPAVVLRDYRASHSLRSGSTVASEGPCEVRLEDEGLLIRSARTVRLRYEEVEAVTPRADGVEAQLFPEGTLTLRGLDGALVRPLFLHFSRLRGLRWATLLRYARSEAEDSLECRIGRDEGSPAEGLAQVHSEGLVLMPYGAEPFQLPGYDLRRVELTPDYRLVAEGHGTRATLFGAEPTALRRFARSAEAARMRLAKETSDLLLELFPAIEFPALLRLTELLAGGRPVPRAQLDAIVPWLWTRIEERVASDLAAPEAYDYLRTRSDEAWWFGVRRLTDLETSGAPEAPAVAPGEPTPEPETGRSTTLGEEGRPEYGFWFLTGVSVGSHRFLISETAARRRAFATYVYRCREAGTDTEAFAAAAGAVANAHLGLHFYREPISASSTEIESGRFAEYKLAIRKLPDLKEARALFVGRAVHTNPEAWKSQLDRLLGGDPRARAASEPVRPPGAGEEHRGGRRDQVGAEPAP